MSINGTYKTLVRKASYIVSYINCSTENSYYCKHCKSGRGFHPHGAAWGTNADIISLLTTAIICNRFNGYK